MSKRLVAAERLLAPAVHESDAVSLRPQVLSARFGVLGCRMSRDIPRDPRQEPQSSGWKETTTLDLAHLIIGHASAFSTLARLVGAAPEGSSTPTGSDAPSGENGCAAIRCRTGGKRVDSRWRDRWDGA
jgi:hypothetical protein